ncbi:uncharacterized protein LOC132740428, partial [Ruditapes philippinarum]|uniref:uncharacterized protein LOC132740428 n=1 Tax=Ruditapes philippinarum TaxID=129788 RepID=UPI00295BC60B
MTTLACLVVVLLGVMPHVYAVAPVFITPNPDVNNPLHKLYLDEDKKGNDVVVVLTATDADTDDNTLVFSMDTSPSQTKDVFEINIRTLRVKSTVPAGYFDYEKYGGVRVYKIILQVTDGTDTTTLKTKLYIRDLNEPPKFWKSPPYNVNVGQSWL